MKRSWLAVPAALLALPLLTAAPAQADRPAMTVQVVRSGLDIPWDLDFLPNGSMLYTERGRMRLTLRTTAGAETRILDAPSGMWASGETGLMSVSVADDFAKTRDFITCHGYRSGSTQDVRVVRWHLNAAMTSASIRRTLVRGLPSTSGRHGGCALVPGPHHVLYIGTGDAATGRNPQRLTSGGGKVLRIDSRTGRGTSKNPFRSSRNTIKQKIYTYGHRNVQGLARRSGGTIWSVEHGSYRDDEVNRLVKGGNFGWNPVRRRASDPSYNEGSNSPMTDHSLPGQQRSARWRSGDPTVATSGAAFVSGSRWKSWNGALAVTALKDSSLRLMSFSRSGKLRSTWKPAQLDGTHGRLRGAVRGPGGALYLTTSNGGGNDKILKVTPH